MFSLAGKSCVVTGASRGLGRAIALALASQGADVVLTARSRDDLEQVRAEIAALGRRAVVRAGDVTDLAHLQAVGDAAVSTFGTLDVWVNNAGGDTSIAGGWAEWLDVTEEGWERMLRLNLKAQVFGAQAAARLMRAGARGGSIIFLSSIDGLYAAPGGEGIYGACKAAINNITQTMAVELGQYQIRVNAIAPAVVETPLTAPWLGDGGGPAGALRVLPAPARRPAGGRRRRRGLFRLRRGGVGLGIGPARVRRRRDDQRSLSLPDARQQGRDVRLGQYVVGRQR